MVVGLGEGASLSVCHSLRTSFVHSLNRDQSSRGGKIFEIDSETGCPGVPIPGDKIGIVPKNANKGEGGVR